MSTGKVYALCVGIDRYEPPIPPLRGCVNDLRHLEQFLVGRLGDRLVLRTLVDDAATRDDIVATFRSHLGQAGPGDVALFSFNGHGTEEPAPAGLAELEASGKLQVLVCADSGRRVGPRRERGIADKELALLIREVAGRGAHVAVLLDCCHSGSGTRDSQSAIRQWLPLPDAASADDRGAVAELATARGLDGFVAGVVDGWPALGGALDHVALSACQSFQVAREREVAGEIRGVFTHALLTALETAGPGLTYRELLTIARAHVERTTLEQTPAIHPVAPGGPGDAVVLEGTVERRDPTFHVSRGAGGLEVDAGSVHGLRPPLDGERFELTCTTAAGDAVGPVAVTHVDVGRSRVSPLGWEPTDAVYRAAISAVPLPRAIIVVDGSDGSPSGAADLIGRVIDTIGPGGTASPHVRLARATRDTAAETSADTSADATSPIVRFAVLPSAIRVLRADGTPYVPDVTGSSEAAIRRAVGLAEHIARWEQLRGLEIPGSTLAHQVRLDVFGAASGDLAEPPRLERLDAEGGCELSYVGGGADPVPPRIVIRLTNTSDRHLHVALVDLTDRFACRTRLFPTERIAPGHTVAVQRGAPIPVALPRGRRVETGALGRDWLKLIVAEGDFDASSFELAALDEPPVERPLTRAGASTLDRLARRAITRDGDSDSGSPAAAAWAARTFAFTVRVP